MTPREATGWFSIIGGLVTITVDLSTSEGHTGTGLSLLALILIVFGVTRFEIGTRGFWIAEVPPHLAHLEFARTYPAPDLSTLTDEQLEAVRREQMQAAWEQVGEDGFDAAMEALDRSRDEMERRLEITRTHAGWAWPNETKEGAA